MTEGTASVPRGAGTPSTVKLLGFAGSLREGSYNRAALRVAAGVLPAGVTMEIFDLAPIPLYNEDVRAAGLPAPVQRFRGEIAAADALLVVTPEYNYSVPGVLKNAIDWVSRPPDQPFAGKPVAVMGASGGGFGTVRAQLHLRQIFVFLDMHPLNRPEVMISSAGKRFDAEGNLTDETTRARIAELVEALAAFTRRLRGY